MATQTEELEEAPPSRQAWRRDLAEDMKPIEEALAKPTPPEPPKPTTEPAAVVPEPPKTATPPVVDVDAEIESGRRNPKSEDFKRVKGLVGVEKKRADELERKWNESQAELQNIIKNRPNVTTEELAKKEADLQKFQTLYNEIALEFNPAFHQKYQARKETALLTLRANVPKEAADKLQQLFETPESEAKRNQIIALTAEMDELQKSEVIAANREYQRINSERNGELSNAEQKMAGIIQEREGQRKARSESMTKAFESVIGELSDPAKGVPGFQLREEKNDDDRAFNKGVKERIEVARAYYSGLEDDSERAKQVSWAALAPELMTQLKATRAELASRDAVIAKLQGASPDLHGDGGKGERQVKKSFKDNVSNDIDGRG